MKNPYIIPIIGIIILVLLMMFQKQQARTARELRAAADEAGKLIPELSDSLSGAPATPARSCSSSFSRRN